MPAIRNGGTRSAAPHEYSYDDQAALSSATAVRARPSSASRRRVAPAHAGAYAASTHAAPLHTPIAEPVQEEIAAPIEEAVTTRPRVRRSHRPVRMTWMGSLIGAILLGQLILFLWLKGLALSATHRADKLGDVSHGEIGRVNEAIAQTQKRIAALSSPSQLKQWADERGWRMATPQEFDDVTRRDSVADYSAATNDEAVGEAVNGEAMPLAERARR